MSDLKQPPAGASSPAPDGSADLEIMYDEAIAPKLLDLAKECEQLGLSFLAVVEFRPGETGRTISLRSGSGFGIRLCDAAAKANGNLDVLILAIERYATKNGHSSVYLSMLGIPESPNAQRER